MSAENCGQPLGGRGSAPYLAGGAHSDPPDFVADGRGLLPRPKNPIPALGLRPSVLALQ